MWVTMTHFHLKFEINRGALGTLGCHPAERQAPPLPAPWFLMLTKVSYAVPLGAAPPTPEALALLTSAQARIREADVISGCRIQFRYERN